MDQLGFTFYPQNWWTSKSFIKLAPLERYVYLEALFYMYTNEKGLENDRDFFSKFLRMDIPAETWDNAVKSFNRVGDYLFSDTVLKRRNRAEAARINGQKGGRPGQNEKPKNPEKNQTFETQGTKEKNPGNPPYKEKGKVKGKVKITETPVKGVEGYLHTNGSKPPNPAPRPLYGAGLRDGSILRDVWGKYGKALQTELPKLTRERMLKAWLFFWPYKLADAEAEKVRELIGKLPDDEIRFGLQEIAEYLLEVANDGPEKAYLVMEIFNNAIEFADDRATT